MTDVETPNRLPLAELVATWPCLFGGYVNELRKPLVPRPFVQISGLSHG